MTIADQLLEANGQSGLKPNAILHRTVWSSPQLGEQCSKCIHYASHHTEVSALTVVKPTWFLLGGYQEMYKGPKEFGVCQNLRIWAAYGGERAPITRSYYYCNYFEEKENGM